MSMKQSQTAVTQDNILLTDDNKPSNYEIGITLFAKVCTLYNTICIHIKSKTSNIYDNKLFIHVF